MEQEPIGAPVPETMEDRALPAFAELGLGEDLVRTLEELGYEEPTPIQVQAIPPLLEGRDVLGSAATGTGKTAAFALPMLERLEPGAAGPQALVLAPTRELAVQVAEAIHRYGRPRRISVLPIYGGQPMDRQISGLRRGVDVVVGTPGRVLDHLGRGTLKLERARFVVLDEADEMLDMGFIEDIEEILKRTPTDRQTALFSATFPPRIAQLAGAHLRDPVRVMVRREPLDTPLVRQVAYVVPRPYKLESLGRVLDLEAPTSAIIFCRTRNEVDELTEALTVRGYRPEALHGGLTQPQRDRVMGRFREGTADLLVATDVAARGLDVEHVSHVINYDIPQSPEVYVHRIGRTGRAGRTGTAITITQPRETGLLRGIERVTRQKVEMARIPTVADLRARRLERFRTSLEEALTDGQFDNYRGMVESLAEQYDALDVAAAAVKLAAAGMRGEEAESGVEIPQVEPGRDSSRDSGRSERTPRHNAREHFDRASPGRPSGPMTRLFVGVGRRRGIEPRDLVGAIAGEARIPGSVVGRIEIADQFSLVDVPEEFADRVIQALGNAQLKGRPVTVRRDRDGDDRGGAERSTGGYPRRDSADRYRGGSGGARGYGENRPPRDGGRFGGGDGGGGYRRRDF